MNNNMLPYFYTCISVYKTVTKCSPEVIMTYNCNILTIYTPRISSVLLANITSLQCLKLQVRSHACNAAGRANRPWRRVIHFTIGANDPVLSRANAKLWRFPQLSAARRINHIRHIAGNTPGFCISMRRIHAANIMDCGIDCNTVLANS